MIRAFVVSGKLGNVYFAPYAAGLSAHDVSQPDVLFVSRARMSYFGPDYPISGPDLAVEVLSPSTQ